jgi:hypothetical protein
MSDRPEGHADEPADYRAERVHSALTTDPRVQEPELRVDIVGDVLTITGTVPTEARREAIAAVAAEICPDLEVDNRTAVATLPEASSVERLP